MIHIYVHATVRLIPTINHIVYITNHSIGSITIGGRYYEDIFHFIRQRTLIAKGLMVDWFTSLGLSALEEALLSPTLSLSLGHVAPFPSLASTQLFHPTPPFLPRANLHPPLSAHLQGRAGKCQTKIDYFWSTNILASMLLCPTISSKELYLFMFSSLSLTFVGHCCRPKLYFNDGEAAAICCKGSQLCAF